MTRPFSLMYEITDELRVLVTHWCKTFEDKDYDHLVMIFNA